MFVLKVQSYFLNLKLRNKLLISYLCLLLIPLALIGSFFYMRLTSDIEAQAGMIVTEALKQTDLHITYMLTEIENLGNMLFQDRDLQSILRKENEPVYEQVGDFEQILKIIEAVESYPRVYSVRIFVPDAKLYTRANNNIFSLEEIKHDKYYQDLVNGNKQSGWTEGYTYTSTYGRTETVISFVIFLKDFSNFNRSLGCVYIDILSSEFSAILDEIKIGEGGSAFIMNNSGKTLINTGRTLQSTNVGIDSLKLSAGSGVSGNSTVGRLTFNNLNYVVSTREINHAGWQLIYVLPAGDILKDTYMAAWPTFLLAFVFILLSAASAVLVVNRITHSIPELIGKMKGIHELFRNDFPVDADVYPHDEIGQLQVSFYSMVARIRSLLDENNAVQLEKRKAELRALQAQINPHFLYNVLDSVNWMAIRAKVMSISEMVESLGRFYRISLSGGRDVITIGEELEHVHLYIGIQKIRFQGAIDTEFHIDNAVLHYPIVKFTLQPVVENAIVHGIMGKPSQHGRLQIHAFSREALVVIQVLDDGDNFNLEKVQQVLAEPEKENSGGYGLKNVNERIKLYFGKEYGLTIMREEGRWTKVELCLPALGNY